jgi:5-methylphenazine-1-carboxylate 1-monooxygenase
MKAIIVGAGIGGLTTALMLHRVGIEVEIFEQARSLNELGVGINLLPHGTRELADLGLLPDLDAGGIRTRELIYMDRFGNPVWRDLRGTDAGYDTPQFSIHRGKLQTLLAAATRERVGSARLHTGCCLTDFEDHPDRVLARFAGRDGSAAVTAAGDVLIGCDGIHSAVRTRLYPHEGPPRWSGHLLWRGATAWPTYADGRTMVIAGGKAGKFVFYPIHADSCTTGQRLTNWAVMAPLGRPGDVPPRREDWSRPGNREEALSVVRDAFKFGFVDPVALIGATEVFYEYPNCDREPLPRWSFGRVTLLGDAAHPMYPVGSNGASQAILDARAIARHLCSGLEVPDALTAYDEERRPPTGEIVLRNREGGPERVIDAIESRAPHGFSDVERVLSYAEREAIVRGYATLAGYAVSQVNQR